MTGKQNFIFFLGLALIILQLFVSGQLRKLTSAMFHGAPNSNKSSSSSGGSAPGAPVPFTPFGLISPTL